MIEIGSVADWVGAIGTVAAFGGGVFLWHRDLRAKALDLPNQFSLIATWYEGHNPPSGYAGREDPAQIPYVEIAGVNASPKPVHGVTIEVDRGDGVLEGFVKLGNVSSSLLKPGEPIHWIGEDAAIQAKQEIFVSFTDGNGRIWHRSLKDSKYTSHKKWQKLLSRPSQPSLKYSDPRYCMDDLTRKADE